MCAYMSKLIEWDSLNMCSLLYFSFTSIRLENFLKIKSKIKRNALKDL